MRHACSEEDIGEIQREIAALKECQSPAITQARAAMLCALPPSIRTLTACIPAHHSSPT